MESLALFFHIDSFLDSPFIVPVAGCAMTLGIVLAGIWSGNRTQEMRSRERLECIARGVTPPPTIEELALMNQGKGLGAMERRKANLRLTGIILLATSVGIILFFVALAIVLHVRGVLAGAAVGLIPMAIGGGFLLDTKIQRKEIESIGSASEGLQLPK